MRRFVYFSSTLVICLTSCSLWLSRHADDWIEDTSGVTSQVDTTLLTGLPDSSIVDLVFPDAELTMTVVNNTAGESGGMVAFETDVTVDTVLNFYDKLYVNSDWAVTSSMESTDRDVRTVMYNFAAEDSSTAIVTVQEEKGKTYITIMYGEE